jgi:hypothetical protein
METSKHSHEGPCAACDEAAKTIADLTKRIRVLEARAASAPSAAGKQPAWGDPKRYPRT